MSEALNISRLRARYSVRGSAAQAKARLDNVVRSAGSEALAAASARLGLPDSEVVCVKALDVAVRVRLSNSDRVLVLTWAEAFAAALALAVSRGEGVLRYGSRAQVQVDVLTSVARGDLSRAWAWRQAGLWTASAGAAAAMLGMPHSVPAALAAVARAGELGRLVARVKTSDWTAIGQAVLAKAVGGERGVLDRHLPLAGFPDSEALVARSSTLRALEKNVRQRSAIAAAVASLAGLEVTTRAALLVLAILEVEPTAFARLTEPRELIDALVAGGEGTLDKKAPGREEPHALQERLAETIFLSNTTTPTEHEEAFPAHAVRRKGQTRAGGLLFLLHVVEELELARSLCAAATPLASRPLRWGLHQLALCLLPLEPEDAAALAFAGLPPDAEPPSRGAEPPTESEHSALALAADAVVARLRERLDAPDELRANLLFQICRRSAEIVADPAWIEIRLRLDEVSTSIRKAGLDLDLGWLAWLGCVVRFHYA